MLSFCKFIIFDFESKDKKQNPMKVKVCLIQDNPIFFDKKKTIQKLETFVKEYAQKGCELIVFPESFIPGYPRSFSFGTKIG